MPGIYNMMDISRWALHASTRALDTISHNVANVNTEGYSRQETVLATRTAQWTGEGWYGNGVKVANVIQHVDRQLQKDLTTGTSRGNYYDTYLSQLSALEALDNEAGESSLGQSLTDFFNGWQQLSLNPESTASRQTLIESAQNLASRLNSLNSDLEQIGRNLDGYLTSTTDQINQLCRSIADLNTQIVGGEANGKTANDLRDQRQNALNDLAGKLNISWFEDANGAVSVYTGQGTMLVQGDYPSSGDSDPLVYRSVDGYADKQVVSTATGQVMDSSVIDGGTMGAYLQTRDGDLAGMQSFIDDLSHNLIWQVNYQHSQGSGQTMFSDVTGTYKSVDFETALNSASNTLPFKDQLKSGSLEIWVYQDGTRRSYTVNVDPNDHLTAVVQKINAVINPAGDDTVNPVASVENGQQLRFHAANGIQFGFANDTSGLLAVMGINTFFQGEVAGTMTVNDLVAADAGRVCAGRLLDTGELAVGDNRNALDIADLKDADTMTGGSQTFNEAVIAYSTALGSKVANAKDGQTFVQSSNTQLQDLRDQVSGVNMDDEMIKMIQYQRAYQSAAKMISVADEMLQTLLEIKR